MTKGCHWQWKSFKVYMGNTKKEPDRCLSCIFYKTKKCRDCKGEKKFQNRGFALIDKRRKFK